MSPSLIITMIYACARLHSVVSSGIYKQQATKRMDFHSIIHEVMQYFKCHKFGKFGGKNL